MSHRHVAEPLIVLPLVASRSLLAVAAKDHACANVLRIRATGEHSRNQMRRSRRMGVASRRLEADSRDMAAEGRA